MEIQTKIESFQLLAQFIQQFIDQKRNAVLDHINTRHYEKIFMYIKEEYQLNAWFTYENILSSFKGIIHLLDKNMLDHWISQYYIKSDKNPLKIFLVMAGNIPMVGFHDLLCVIMSGNHAVCKLSSKDNRLFRAVIEVLFDINPEFRETIIFAEEKYSGFDAVIATGSNNTSRYFEYYFGKYPHIIRKNRNSMAVLTGNESKEDIRKLADDIFMYYGLGCRNVSKILVPFHYDFNFFFENIESYHSLLSHNKYMNNHDYNRSVYMLNQIKHLDNDFLIVKEEIGLSSPIGVLYYQTYCNMEEINSFIHENTENIQCIVAGDNNYSFETVPFGLTQFPGIMDYADHMDTMKFLVNINGY